MGKELPSQTPVLLCPTWQVLQGHREHPSLPTLPPACSLGTLPLTRCPLARLAPPNLASKALGGWARVDPKPHGGLRHGTVTAADGDNGLTATTRENLGGVASRQQPRPVPPPARRARLRHQSCGAFSNTNYCCSPAPAGCPTILPCPELTPHGSADPQATDSGPQDCPHFRRQPQWGPPATHTSAH